MSRTPAAQDLVTFSAPIRSAGGGGAFVEIPYNVESAYGRKRVPVIATIDGEPYRGTLVRMGSECHMLIVLKEIREKIGKDFGDDVTVTLQEDTQPRTVEVPEDFAAALSDNRTSNEYFQKLSYTHRREYVQWIESAKKNDTRINRISKAVTMLSEGKIR
jgi:hypothetical protein